MVRIALELREGEILRAGMMNDGLFSNLTLTRKCLFVEAGRILIVKMPQKQPKKLRRGQQSLQLPVLAEDATPPSATLVPLKIAADFVHLLVKTATIRDSIFWRIVSQAASTRILKHQDLTAPAWIPQP